MDLKLNQSRILFWNNTETKQLIHKDTPESMNRIKICWNYEYLGKGKSQFVYRMLYDCW